MRIKETKVYPFDELSEDAKEKAIEKLYDINVDYEWWDSTYDDAVGVKLKLTEFDIGRPCYCRGEFIEYAKDTADAIIFNHGASCPTHETATAFIEDSAELYMKYPVKLDDDGDDENEIYRETEQGETDDEFLKSILEDYRLILQKEYEYLTSGTAIIETIEANEYEFTEDGKLA
ncbi:hypothetical protein LCGC14_0922960 [marine sediment metagenome]|uniref:Uncharacterized protein n=1 Tax=marine sediment metagenome TaxID=412755 RepID=A0A0F9RWR3_9ZZZZ